MANQAVSVNRNFDDAAISGLVNGDDFTINTNAKLTINSGVRGWIHVVGETTTTITVPRLGLFEALGDWYV